jgi:hypothetical protein
MALLGNPEGGMVFGTPGSGRMGDYVFNQEGESILFQSSLNIQDLNA